MSLQFRAAKPCGDCLNGICTMNCATAGRWENMNGWQPADTAPKTGDHILVCDGEYTEHWTFNQRPPIVVHYWPHSGDEGFYMSSGGYDQPITFTHWLPLVGTEPRKY